jgi:hypothetical protein
MANAEQNNSSKPAPDVGDLDQETKTIIQTSDPQAEIVLKKTFGSGGVSTTNRFSTGAWANTTALLNQYNMSPYFRGVVGKIGDGVASQPILAGAVMDKKSGKARRIKAAKGAESRDDFIALDDHLIVDVINGGNDAMDGYSVNKLINIYLDTSGDCGILKERNKQGVVTALWVVPPHWITSLPCYDEPYYKVTFGDRQIPADDMMFFKDPDITNPYGRGVGIGVALGSELDTGHYAAELTKVAFANRGRPGAIVSIVGAGKEGIDQVDAKWNNNHTGPSNYGRTHFTNKEIDYKKIVQSFEELQLIPLKEEQRNAILQVFGMPPEIMGRLANSNRATIDAAVDIFTRLVVSPRLDRLVRFYQRFLVPEFDDRIILYYDSPVPENQTQKLATMKSAAYQFTRNQWLQQAGFETEDDGDVRYVPMNLIAVDESEAASDSEDEQEEMQEELNEQGSEQEQDASGPDDLAEQDGAKAAQQKAVTKGLLTVGEIEKVVDALDPILIQREVLPWWPEELEQWGTAALAEAGTDFVFNMANPAVIRHLENLAGETITKQINENTKKELKKQLAEGVLNDESARQLQDRIKKAFNDGGLGDIGTRAGRIARTETMKSSNFGNQTAFKQSGVIDEKNWVPALINTRDAHKAPGLLDNPVPIDGVFIVDGEQMRYPGDSNGSAGNVVNCQCVVRPVVPEVKAPSADMTDQEYWLDYQSRKRAWELKAERGFGDGLHAQEDAALEEFDRIMARRGIEV